jgi:glycosyltransferase involved in cell wall biosynthesis
MGAKPRAVSSIPPVATTASGEPMTAAASAAGEAAGTACRSPQASVVMPVYNDLRFLDEAVDSILRQEFSDLELVIVDDGNGQDAIFEALRRRDPRIRIVTNPVNLGAAVALNRGIDAARADIIVRLDADDIAEPGRVGRLVAALDGDPQLGLIGSAVTFIDEAGERRGVEQMPETDLEIRWTILFHNPFYHSAVAFRRGHFEAAGRYRNHELISQDHYLWFDMLPFCRARNLAEPLARYRLNPRGLVATNATNPRGRTHAIREALWARLGLAYDLHDDAFAADLTQFLKGNDIAPERRAAAYRRLLSMLRTYLDAARPFARAEDASAARKLAQTIVGRVLAHPPPRLGEMLAVCRLCWPLDRRAAVTAALRRLGTAFKFRGQATARWLVRPLANRGRLGK